MPNCKPSACTRRLSDSTPLGNAAASGARLPSASRSGACLRARVNKGVAALCQRTHAPTIVQRHERVSCERGDTCFQQLRPAQAVFVAQAHAPTFFSPSATSACAASRIVRSVTLQLGNKRGQRATKTPAASNAPKIVPRVKAHRRRQAKAVVQAAAAADEGQRERSIKRHVRAWPCHRFARRDGREKRVS